MKNIKIVLVISFLGFCVKGNAQKKIDHSQLVRHLNNIVWKSKLDNRDFQIIEECLQRNSREINYGLELVYHNFKPDNKLHELFANSDNVLLKKVAAEESYKTDVVYNEHIFMLDIKNRRKQNNQKLDVENLKLELTTDRKNALLTLSNCSNSLSSDFIIKTVTKAENNVQSSFIVRQLFTSYGKIALNGLVESINTVDKNYDENVQRLMLQILIDNNYLIESNQKQKVIKLVQSYFSKSKSKNVKMLAFALKSILEEKRFLEYYDELKLKYTNQALKQKIVDSIQATFKTALPNPIIDSKKNSENVSKIKFRRSFQPSIGIKESQNMILIEKNKRLINKVFVEKDRDSKILLSQIAVELGDRFMKEKLTAMEISNIRNDLRKIIKPYYINDINLDLNLYSQGYWGLIIPLYQELALSSNSILAKYSRSQLLLLKNRQVLEYFATSDFKKSFKNSNKYVSFLKKINRDVSNRILIEGRVTDSVKMQKYFKEIVQPVLDDFTKTK